MVTLEKHGPWALITGASAGIGETFARQLSAIGMNLFLTARREERLEGLKRELEEASHIEVRCLPLDLGERGAVERLDKETSELDLGLIINNAGFGAMGLFLDQDTARIEEMVRLNCLSTMLVAHRFGNRLLKRGRGGMIITASLAAFMATPFMGVYGATKAFDLMVGEAMAKELEGTGVDLLVLCPGSTQTEFGRVAGSAGGGRGGMDVEPVVAAAIRSLGRKRVLTTGFANKATAFLVRFFPRRLTNTLSAASLGKMVPRGRRRRYDGA